MLRVVRIHNGVAVYAPLLERFSAEEFANCAITLCHMVDRMLMTYLEKLEKKFMSEGGIRERMTAARQGKRLEQNQEIASLKAEVEKLRCENQSLQAEIMRLKG